MFTIDHGQNIFAWYKSLHTRSKSFRSHFRRFNATILDRCFFFKNMRSTFEDIWLKTYHINPRFAALALKAFPADSRSSQSVSDDSQPPSSRGYLAVRSRFSLMKRKCIEWCQHASSAFIFASTSSDQFYHASSEHFVIFSPAGISLYWNVLRQAWLTLSKQDNKCNSNQHDKALLRFNHSQYLTANYALFSMPFAAKSLLLASREPLGGR